MSQIEGPHVFAIIPAAGSANRMGLGVSKALLLLKGKSIIQRTVETILSCRLVQRAVIPVRDQDRESFLSLPLDWNRVTLVSGGATRQDSVFRGIAALKSTVVDPGNSYILVHDAARCLVSTTLVERTITGAVLYGAVTAAVPVIDSIKQAASDGTVEATIPREKLVAVQTPQVFSLRILQRAHELALSGEKVPATDDASLVEQIHTVHIVQGDRINLKITCPEDLPYAELLLSQQGNTDS